MGAFEIALLSVCILTLLCREVVVCLCRPWFPKAKQRSVAVETDMVAPDSGPGLRSRIHSRKNEVPQEVFIATSGRSYHGDHMCQHVRHRPTKSYRACHTCFG